MGLLQVLLCTLGLGVLNLHQSHTIDKKIIEQKRNSARQNREIYAARKELYPKLWEAGHFKYLIEKAERDEQWLRENTR